MVFTFDVLTFFLFLFIFTDYVNKCFSSDVYQDNVNLREKEITHNANLSQANSRDHLERDLNQVPLQHQGIQSNQYQAQDPNQVQPEYAQQVPSNAYQPSRDGAQVPPGGYQPPQQQAQQIPQDPNYVQTQYAQQAPSNAYQPSRDGAQVPPGGYQPPQQQAQQIPQDPNHVQTQYAQQAPSNAYQPSRDGAQVLPGGYQPPQQIQRDPNYVPPQYAQQVPPNVYQPSRDGAQVPLQHTQQVPPGGYQPPQQIQRDPNYVPPQYAQQAPPNSYQSSQDRAQVPPNGYQPPRQQIQRDPNQVPLQYTQQMPVDSNRAPQHVPMQQQNGHIYSDNRPEHSKKISRDYQQPRSPKASVPPEYRFEESFNLPTKNIDFKDYSDYVAMGVVVPRGVKQCYFYNPISNFEVEYQVLKGGGLDIGLFIKDPEGEPIAVRSPITESQIPITVPSHFLFAPYGICLDNRKSTFGDKEVFISIDLTINWENPNEMEKKVIENLRLKAEQDLKFKSASAEHVENIGNILSQLDLIHGRLRRIEHLQQRWKNFELIDTSLMENNMQRVQSGSTYQFIIMIGVALLQVFFIRSLFNQNSQLYKWCIGKRSQNLKMSC